jgi:predicted oxidoreductase
MTKLKTFLEKQLKIQQQESDRIATEEIKSQFRLFVEITKWSNILEHIQSDTVDELFDKIDDALEVISENEIQSSLAKILNGIILRRPLTFLELICDHEKQRLIGLGYTL